MILTVPVTVPCYRTLCFFLFGVGAYHVVGLGATFYVKRVALGHFVHGSMFTFLVIETA